MSKKRSRLELNQGPRISQSNVLPYEPLLQLELESKLAGDRMSLFPIPPVVPIFRVSSMDTSFFLITFEFGFEKKRITFRSFGFFFAAKFKKGRNFRSKMLQRKMRMGIELKCWMTLSIFFFTFLCLLQRGLGIKVGQGIAQEFIQLECCAM